MSGVTHYEASDCLRKAGRFSVVWKENYRPYGDRLINQPAGAGNRLWFVGKPFDAATGLSYLGARYYSPTLGRFLSFDPKGIDPEDLHALNGYVYANNNPYRFVDPDGHSPVDVAFLIYDIGKLGLAIHRGDGIGAAAADVALSAVGVVIPVPGAGQAMKAARVVKHGADAVRAVEKTAQTAAGVAKSGPVVIGETMGRVEAAASKIPGSKILNDMPDFKALGQNADQVTSSMMQYNRKWILEQMRSGRPILDIGKDPNRAVPSIFYQMEQNMIKNYQTLHPEWNSVMRP